MSFVRRSADASPMNHPKRCCVSRRKSPLWHPKSATFGYLAWNAYHTCVSGIGIHWAKSFVWCQKRAGPFPDAAQLRLSGKSVAIRRHGNRVPIGKSNVAILQVPKHGNFYVVVLLIEAIAATVNFPLNTSYHQAVTHISIPWPFLRRENSAISRSRLRNSACL